MYNRPKRILWPTDFSELSQKAKPYVRDLVADSGGTLHLLHIVPPMTAPDLAIYYPHGMGSSITEQEIVDSAIGNLKDLAGEICSDTSRVTCHAEVGTVWAGVCAYAEKHEIELIVMATHGLSGIKHVLIGSIAERVVQHAPCAVLTVK